MRGQLRGIRTSKLIGIIATLIAIVIAFSFFLFKLRPPEPVVLAPSSSEASTLRILAVGRQGYDNQTSKDIAKSMERAAADQPAHAVFLLGDNFFPKGVASVGDAQWETKFERRYDGAHLRGLPFFAVVGNHDHDGNEMAEVAYSRERKGTARWHMDNLYYTRDFGRVDNRILVRVVFLDTINCSRHPEEQLDFAAHAFERPGDPIWRVVAGHYPLRSLTRENYQQRRILSALLPRFQTLNVDLYVSANDYFQQILDRPGEPLHVSTNGGSDLQSSDVRPENAEQDIVRAQPGFAILNFDDAQMTVELLNQYGKNSVTRRRKR